MGNGIIEYLTNIDFMNFLACPHNYKVWMKYITNKPSGYISHFGSKHRESERFMDIWTQDLNL